MVRKDWYAQESRAVTLWRRLLSYQLRREIEIEIGEVQFSFLCPLEQSVLTIRLFEAKVSIGPLGRHTPPGGSLEESNL